MLNEEEFGKEQNECPHCGEKTSCVYHWAVWFLHESLDIEEPDLREKWTSHWISIVKKDWDRLFKS